MVGWCLTLQLLRMMVLHIKKTDTCCSCVSFENKVNKVQVEEEVNSEQCPLLIKVTFYSCIRVKIWVCLTQLVTFSAMCVRSQSFFQPEVTISVNSSCWLTTETWRKQRPATALSTDLWKRLLAILLHPLEFTLSYMAKRCSILAA